MHPHEWEVEEVDGGPVGVGEFWICKRCGASGGPVWYDNKFQARKPAGAPFLAGPAMKLSSDCDEAKRQIKVYRKSLRKRNKTPSEIRKEYARLLTLKQEIEKNLESLRRECAHPNAEKDLLPLSDNDGWIDFKCPDCGEFWITD